MTCGVQNDFQCQPIMLAKLKYLKEEAKALKDIETMVKEQVYRLQQEELYLKSVLRNPNGPEDPFPVSVSRAKKDLFDIDKTVNEVPLDDLQSTSHQQHQLGSVEDAERDDGEEEENDDEEDMDSGDCQGSQEEEEDGINKDLMALMRQMQGEDLYEDDF